MVRPARLRAMVRPARLRAMVPTERPHGIVRAAAQRMTGSLSRGAAA
jgi:hypothetical protein